MRTKKIENPSKLFRSIGNFVGIRADGHVSSMRGPSVMPSVLTVGMRADRHVACMRCPSVMPSVLTVSNVVGIRADGHVSGMRSTNSR